MLKTAIRVPGGYPPRAIILSAVTTGVLLPLTAALVVWLVPAGCDIRGDKALYRWTCLLPGLLIVVPVAVAILLALASHLNHRLDQRLPDGWLVTTLGAGLVSHVVLVGSYLVVLGPAYHSMFLEVILIPQPFVAGAISGAVFGLTPRLGRPRIIS